MDKKHTSHQVSMEVIGTATILVAAGSLLAQYSPQIIKFISEKVSAKAAGAVIDTVKTQIAGAKTGDLVRFTQSARVEPIMLMDKRAVNIPFIQDVVHSAYNMFTGYWLLAVSLDTTINKVSVGRRLDKFATDRDLADATMTMFENMVPSMESLLIEESDFGLPFIADILAEEDRVSMEAVNDGDMVSANVTADIIDDGGVDNRTDAQKRIDERNQKQADAAAAERARREQQVADQNERRNQQREDQTKSRAQQLADQAKNRTQQQADQAANRQQQLEDDAERKGNMKNGQGVMSASKYVEKINNLAVGNVIDVTISENGIEATVPVTIRLRVAGMPADVMVQTLAVGGTDVTMRSRWRSWRAGEIGFWSDFVLQMDRVDAHRAAMMKDQSGYYKAVYGRAANNKAAASIAGGPSLGTASAIIVMDVKTAIDLERKIGGQLSSFKTRQGIFGHTFSMLMLVVDPDWESVTIYTRGIEMPTKLNKNDIKTAGKSDSKELMDILKSYQLGKAPGRI